MKDFAKLTAVLNEMVAFFEDFSKLEKQKVESVVINDTVALEEHMKTEMAYSMKMKGLDKKREQIITELGYNNDSIKEVIDNPSTKQEELLSKSYFNLRETLQEFKEVSTLARKEIDKKKMTVDILLDRLQHTQSQDTYTKDAKPSKDGTQSFKTQKV